MELAFLFLGLGFAIFGYFVGDGLKHFGKGDASDQSVKGNYKLIRQEDIHFVLGISREDAEKLIEEHPEIPHIKINNKIYFSRSEITEWLKNPNKKTT